MLCSSHPITSLISMQSLESLSPIRRVIINRYIEIKKNDRRSKVHLARRIANELGYKIDRNGTNTYVMRVLGEFTM